MDYTKESFKKELSRLEKLKGTYHWDDYNIGVYDTLKDLKNLILFGVSISFNDTIKTFIEELELEKQAINNELNTYKERPCDLDDLLICIDKKIKALKTALNEC